MKKIILLLLCLLLLAALLIGAMLYSRLDENIENAGTAQNAKNRVTFLTHDGQEYPIAKHLQTILFIGTDSRGSSQTPHNGTQADLLLLMVLDKKADTVEIIQLHPDTMTEVPQPDGSTKVQQLSQAFSIGNGGSDSCRNTVSAASGLLFGALIDNYIQLPVSEIFALNDLIGGVPVAFTEDMTQIDPAFTAGSTVNLTGAQARQYIQASGENSIQRMTRQRIYMDSFYDAARNALKNNPGLVLELARTLGKQVCSDLSTQQLSSLAANLSKSKVSSIRFADGQLQQDDPDAFYVDSASLWELVKNAYCE